MFFLSKDLYITLSAEIKALERAKVSIQFCIRNKKPKSVNCPQTLMQNTAPA
jgi:hypothetical protein